MKQTMKRSRNIEPTIDELFTEFYQDRLYSGRVGSTLDNYEISYSIYKRSNGFLGGEMPSELGAQSIRNLIDDCQERELSTYTINFYLRSIRAFINFCRSRSSSVPDFKIKVIKTQETEPKFYTDDEIDRLLRRPANANDYVEVRTWVIVNLMCATGARIGTVCSLQVGDVDFKRGIISYRHTKNKRYMSIPMTPAITPILRTYVCEWRSDAKVDDSLFCNCDGEPLTRNANRLAFERYCEARGVDGRGVHQLRHAFARTFVLAGGDPFQLQTALGHSDLQMSKHYCSVWGEDLKEGFAQFALLDKRVKTKVKPKRNV